MRGSWCDAARRDTRRVGITLSSHDAFLSALADARYVALSSYVLTQDLADRLIACADRGAEVHVRLSAHLVGDTTGRRTAAAARTVKRLLEHGVDAALTGEGDTAPHLKAAAIDNASNGCKAAIACAYYWTARNVRRLRRAARSRS